MVMPGPAGGLHARKQLLPDEIFALFELDQLKHLSLIFALKSAHCNSTKRYQCSQ